MCCTKIQDYLSRSSLSLSLSHSHLHIHAHTLSLSLSHTHTRCSFSGIILFLENQKTKEKVFFFFNREKNSFFGDFNQTSFEDANQDFSPDGLHLALDSLETGIVLVFRGPD